MNKIIQNIPKEETLTKKKIIISIIMLIIILMIGYYVACQVQTTINNNPHIDYVLNTGFPLWIVLIISFVATFVTIIVVEGDNKRVF